MPKVPMIVTSMLAMLVLYFTGVTTAAETFSGFSSVATFILIGMSFVTSAFFSTGLADMVGNFLLKFSKGDEKKFIILMYIIVAAFSGFVNGLVLSLLIMPLIDAVAVKSNGSITRKNTYIVLIVAAMLGSNTSIMGASSILAASGMLAETSYGKGFTFFQPATIGLPAVIIGLIFYMTIGQKLQKKFFDFKENLPTDVIQIKSSPAHMTKKMLFTLIVMSITILCLIFGSWNMGAVAFAAATILLLTGCVSVEEAIRSVSWSGVLTMVGMLGFAKGMEVSGAGDLVANVLISMRDYFGLSAYLMCVLCLLLTVVMSNFMSNNAAVMLVFPIAVSLAEQLGTNPLPFALCVAVGACTAIATPICAPMMSLTLPVGYRFKDYLMTGGILNIGTFIATAITLKIVYF